MEYLDLIPHIEADIRNYEAILKAAVTEVTSLDPDCIEIVLDYEELDPYVSTSAHNDGYRINISAAFILLLDQLNSHWLVACLYEEEVDKSTVYEYFVRNQQDFGINITYLFGATPKNEDGIKISNFGLLLRKFVLSANYMHELIVLSSISVMFVLFHELAHLMLGHFESQSLSETRSADEFIYDEMDADLFATLATFSAYNSDRVARSFSEADSELSDHLYLAISMASLVPVAVLAKKNFYKSQKSGLGVSFHKEITGRVFAFSIFVRNAFPGLSSIGKDWEQIFLLHHSCTYSDDYLVQRTVDFCNNIEVLLRDLHCLSLISAESYDAVAYSDEEARRILMRYNKNVAAFKVSDEIGINYLSKLNEYSLYACCLSERMGALSSKTIEIWRRYIGYHGDEIIGDGLFDGAGFIGESMRASLRIAKMRLYDLEYLDSQNFRTELSYLVEHIDQYVAQNNYLSWLSKDDGKYRLEDGSVVNLRGARAKMWWPS